MYIHSGGIDKMQGKNILVTGASKGIGRGVAEYLLQKGATVILVARSKEQLEELAERYPKQAYVFSCDLTEMEKIEDIFIFCREKGMKLDGFFYAAGVEAGCPVKSIEKEFMLEVFQINFFSLVQMAKFFVLRKYSNDGASVVVMSSASAKLCDKGMTQYASSKSAINAFVKVMSKEMTKRRIRVNALAPGFVDTEMTWRTREKRDDFDDYLASVQPYGVIPVEQIAYLAEFLLSDKARFMTGTIIPVTAGMEGL